ncbi:hypothetical protein F4818DRAFT_380722 [Hypoxylon cercidicola]|nr:hypothetical protein F4818DRAFT_380722 [Hypoxylon cercidicola]
MIKHLDIGTSWVYYFFLPSHALARLAFAGPCTANPLAPSRLLYTRRSHDFSTGFQHTTPPTRFGEYTPAQLFDLGSTRDLIRDQPSREPAVHQSDSYPSSPLLHTLTTYTRPLPWLFPMYATYSTGSKICPPAPRVMQQIRRV